QPSEFGLNTEHVEKVAADPQSFCIADFTALGQVEIVSAPRKQTRESFVSIANLFPNRIGDRRISCWFVAARRLHVRETNIHELLRIADRERLETHGVDQFKDRRVRADAQRQRQDSDGSEAGILQKHPHAKTQIVKHYLTPYSYLKATNGSTLVARRAGT